jgi:hypothetical protein
MEEHCRGHHQLGIIIDLLVRQGLDDILVNILIDLLISIYEKYRHTVIHTFLGTTYDASNGRRESGPHLKDRRANGQTGHERRNRWPRTRPLTVSNGCLASKKTAKSTGGKPKELACKVAVNRQRKRRKCVDDACCPGQRKLHPNLGHVCIVADIPVKMRRATDACKMHP